MLYSSSQVGMDAGYFTLVSLLFFQQSLFLFLIFLDIIFTLVKIAIESPESLQDEQLVQLVQIIDIWNKKPRRKLCVVHHILMAYFSKFS